MVDNGLVLVIGGVLWFCSSVVLVNDPNVMVVKNFFSDSRARIFKKKVFSNICPKCLRLIF